MRKIYIQMFVFLFILLVLNTCTSNREIIEHAPTGSRRIHDLDSLVHWNTHIINAN